MDDMQEVIEELSATTGASIHSMKLIDNVINTVETSLMARLLLGSDGDAISAQIPARSLANLVQYIGKLEQEVADLRAEREKDDE